MNGLSAGLLLVHIWIARRVLSLQDEGRPQHTQGACTSSLNLLGQSYSLALPSADAIGVQSQQVGQPPCLPHATCTDTRLSPPLCRCEPRATAVASGLAGAAPWGQSSGYPGVSWHWGDKD